ncbi:MAG: OmpH family outer membrane protein, partial [Bacteroidales bacterium]
RAKQFQVDKLLLSEDMKQKREQAIMLKEREIKKLQNKRFGPDGDRFKKEKELIKPIQDEVYNAIRDYASYEGIGMIFDAASSNLTILYTDPKFDISDDILKKLGYLK